MSRETSVAIIPRHELLAADGGPPSPASRTYAARNYRRDNHRLSQPICHFFTDRNNASGNFVSKNERKSVPGEHAICRKSDIRVAHATPGNLNYDFVCSRL